MRFKRTSDKIRAEATFDEGGDEATPPTTIDADDGSGENSGSRSTTDARDRNKRKPELGSELGSDASPSHSAGVGVGGHGGGGEADPAAARARGDSSDGGADDAGAAAGLANDGRGGGSEEQEYQGGGGRAGPRAGGGGGRRGTGREKTAREEEETGGGGGPERDHYGADVDVEGKTGGASTVATPPGSGGGDDSAAPSSPAELAGESEEEAAAAARAVAGKTETVRAQGGHQECVAATEGGGDGQCHSRTHSRSRADNEGGDPSALPNRGSGGGGAVDLAPAGAPEGSASSADGTGVTGIAGGGGEQQNEAAGLGVESPDGDPSAKSEEGAAGLEAAPGQQTPPVVPAKASRTLADAAAFVEAEGIAADAAYTEALNAAQAQEAHQTQGPATVTEAERALAALAAAALQPSAGSAAAVAAAGVGGGGGGGAANAPAAGVTFTLADRENKEREKEKQLYEGDCSASDIPGVWRQLQAPHMAFIQCQLAVLTGLVMLILVCWRRHGRMISVLYVPPADVATQCQVASTP